MTLTQLIFGVIRVVLCGLLIIFVFTDPTPVSAFLCGIGSIFVVVFTNMLEFFLDD